MNTKNISKNIPFLSVLLVFIGYYNYYSYYSIFDIEIHNYLTTGELLLSFLPLSINILITILIVFIIVALKESPENEVESSENNESFLIELKTRFKKVIFITKPKSILNYLDSLFFFLLQIFVILIISSVR